MYSDNALNRSLVKRFCRSSEFYSLIILLKLHMLPFRPPGTWSTSNSRRVDTASSPSLNSNPSDDSFLDEVLKIVHYAGISRCDSVDSEQINSASTSQNPSHTLPKQSLSPSVISAVQSIFARDFVPFRPNQKAEKHQSAAKHFHCQVALSANLADFILYEILFLAFAFNSLKENLSFNCFTEQRRKALL